MAAVTTQEQVSAGGVVYRRAGPRVEVALISVGEKLSWQLPKGLVGPGEAPAAAAQREVGEETGLEAELVAPLDKVEYWYYGTAHPGGKRLRFHKHVHFFLFRATGGDVSRHDHEVNESRWFEIDEALERLSFASEKTVLRAAKALLADQP